MRLGPLALAFCLAVAPSIFAADAKPAKPSPATAPAVATPAKPAAAKPITGKVTGLDGKPVAGATVRAVPQQKNDVGMRGARVVVAKSVVAKTDAAGAFQLDGLTGSAFVVRVESAGTAPAWAADVPPGAVLNLKLKKGVTVAGRVLDLTTQKPVAGATVTGLERDAAAFGPKAAHTVASLEDGTFQIPDCAPGIVVVEATAPRKARARLDHVVAKLSAPPSERGKEEDAPKPEANVLYLQPGGRVAGRVVGPDGKPLADAVVTATAADGSLFAMLREGRSGAQRTDPDGRFDFDGLVAGNKYTVHAAKDGLAAQDEGPIPIEAGTDRGDLELRLEAGASLAFRLVTAQDAPVKDVDARVVPQAKQGGRRRTFGIAQGVDPDKIVAQGDGRFVIKALDAGTFDVTLQPPDYADVVKEGVRLKSGETTDLGTLRVRESKSIAGKIVDASGQPIAGAAISAFWIDSEARMSREATSGGDGKYRLSGLGDKPVRNLTARATGYADVTKEGAAPGDMAVDFTLEKTGSIVGKVLLRTGGAPPAFRVQAFAEAKERQEGPGFRVVVTNRPDEEQFFTDPSGNFRLDNVDPGVVTVSAKADGKAPTKKTGLKVVSDQVVDAGTIVLDDGRALRGHVLAAKDDAPIAGATVSVSQPQGFMVRMGTDTSAGLAITGLDGRFEIAGLEPRAYAVDANQPDYSPNSGRVEISPDADSDDFVIKLSKGGTITGQVRDAQKQPIPNASVLLTKVPMGGGPQTATSGPDGRYEFEKIAPGDYMVIRAPAAGGPLMLFGGMKQVTVREGETTVYDLDEAAKINVTGRVVKGGQPVANAMLFFSAADPSARDLRQSHTDADGRYQIGLDTPGAYAVAVNTGGAMFRGGPASITVQVPDQPNPVIDVTMKSAGISGRVVNGDGKPVSGALITATLVGGTAAAGAERRRGTADQSEMDGTFLIDSLEPGTYAITVAASGYRNADVPQVTIANDSDVPSIDIRLEAGRTVRGHVLDANGNAIAGAMVMTAPAGSLPAGRDSMPSTSDVNGAFVVTAPADGPIDMTAVAAGFPPARVVGLQPEDGADVLLKAPRPGRVRVNVIGADGRAVGGARVLYRAVPDYLGAGFSFMNATPATGNDGSTTVSSLGPGAYELTVTLGTRKATGSATLPEGGDVLATVTLP